MDENEKTVEEQSILLFKCTGNEIYAIDLSVISRVEEVKANEIELIGQEEYIKFRGDKLRIIHPENYLPVNRDSSGSENKYILIPKHVSHPIGIAVESIIDNVKIRLRMSKEDTKIEGLVGTAVNNNNIILLLNIYELFEMADPEHYHKINSEKQNATLLLVEDTPFFQKQEKEFLESAGFNVVLAGNGEEALSILKTRKVDAVVSDIQMPVMDGIELVRKIRENDRMKRLPVIALTSMSGESQKKLGFENGFDFYEIKLDRDRLIKTVQEALIRERGD
jgi:two-component system chemotaxis sensor kinase CheA